MIHEMPLQVRCDRRAAGRGNSRSLWVPVVIGILGLGGLTACDHLGGQVGEITESYQKRLDEKERELASLRASETGLRLQVSELQGRLAQAEAGGGARGGAGAVDVAALARELAPLLAGVKSEPARSVASPGAPVAAPPAEQGLPELQLSEPKVRSKGEVPRSRGGGEIRSSGSGASGPSGARRPEAFEPVAR